MSDIFDGLSNFPFTDLLKSIGAGMTNTNSFGGGFGQGVTNFNQQQDANKQYGNAINSLFGKPNGQPGQQPQSGAAPPFNGTGGAPGQPQQPAMNILSLLHPGLAPPANLSTPRGAPPGIAPGMGLGQPGIQTPQSYPGDFIPSILQKYLVGHT